MKKTQSSNIPMGLGMALAKNADAMAKFQGFTSAQQQTVIDHTHEIGSKAEMRLFVSDIASGKYVP